jgi:hypothetical protein
MSRDSRPSDQLAEELRDLDAGLQLNRPKVDWAMVVSARRSRRRTVRMAVGSLIVLAIVLPAAWYATQPGNKREDGPSMAGGPGVKPEASPETKQELLAMDRELSQIDRSIVSMKRSQRRALAEKLAKQSKPIVTDSVDPIEEGALVFLAAAEKAERSSGKDASLALYRRLVELFPETRSADIARRQLM